MTRKTKCRPRQKCAVADCQMIEKARGWCNTHYEAWRKHGNPAGSGINHREPQDYMQVVVKMRDGGGCVRWPFTVDRKGYGQMWHEGRTRSVSRVVCEKVHGPPPSPQHHAAHSCGKGHEACVAPWHLSWKTPKENEADKKAHGTAISGEKQWTAKLTEQDVRLIRASRGLLSGVELSRRYGTTPTNVSMIQNRISWRHVA